MKTSRKYIKKNMAKSKKRFSKRGGGLFDFLSKTNPLDKKAEEVKADEKKLEEDVNPEGKKLEEDINPDEKKTAEAVNPDEKKLEEDVNTEEEVKPSESTLEEVNLDEIKPEEGKEEAATEGEKTDVSSTEIFMTDKISTQPCNDSNYKEIGIIHLSDSMALNMLRNAATGVFNVFGQKGFDNSIYDQLRNGCFAKMNDLLKDGQRVCNLRVDIERDEALIYMHLYGTLLEKMVSIADSETENNGSIEGQSLQNEVEESNPQNEEVQSLQNDLEESNPQITEGEDVEKNSYDDE